jgi:phage-related protein
VKAKYFLTSSGRSPVEDFINEQSEELRKEYFDALNRLSEGKVLAMPISRNLSSICPGLHELRLKDTAGQVRVFYFIKRGNAIYLVHAFKKKTQEIPKKEIELILKRIKGI